MNHQRIVDDTNDVDLPTRERTRRSAVRYRLLISIAGTASIVVIGVVALAMLRDGTKEGQTAAMSRQGGTGSTLDENEARLTRRTDGLVAAVDARTPVPGSYEYPVADMIPTWADPHPRVAAGASDAPEVFTVWLFVFNAPELCTDGTCDLDDLGADAAASGGSYQLDGLIADGEKMAFFGHIRLGENPLNGAPLTNPAGAEVHVAIAAHGRALPGADGWRQLNGPVGNPTLWWAATFEP
jgi:hypothetical protein